MSADTMKIPDPIIEPATSAVASKSPRRATSRSEACVTRLERRLEDATAAADELDYPGEDREDDDHRDHQMDVAVDVRHGVAERKAEERHAPDPQHPADDVEGDEPAVGHRPDAGDDRRERADDRHEAREDDRLAAVAVVKVLGAQQMCPTEEQRVLATED